MLSFTIAHLSVIALRIEAAGPRAARTAVPGNVHDPRPRAAAARASSAASAPGSPGSSSRSSTSRRSSSGAIWLALGIAHVRALPAQPGPVADARPHKIVMPKPIVEHEVEYESVLVAFEDDDYSPEAVATAAQARRPPSARHPRARDDHRAAELADRREHAGAGDAGGSRSIDSARVLGGRRVTGHWEKVRAGQAGRRIVDEAREIRARAIVMPLPPSGAAGARCSGARLRPCWPSVPAA